MLSNLKLVVRHAVDVPRIYDAAVVNIEMSRLIKGNE